MERKEENTHVASKGLKGVVLYYAGHKDSVTCTAFSHDSKFVATGDMSGLIIVWDVATKKQVWSFETTDLEVVTNL